MYQKIITHEDFDGLACAVLCSHALHVNHIEFTGPRTVSEARITITKADVVCDLPYPLECGLWFDHHEANLEELHLRGIDPEQVSGRFAPRDSCARVLYEYFTEQGIALPAHFAELVAEADVIDAFRFGSVEEWRKETPGKVVDGTIKLLQQQPDGGKWPYLRSLVQRLKEEPLGSVAAQPDVQERFARYRRLEQEMLELVRADARFLPEDPEQELVVLDLTRHNRRPQVIRQLAYLLFPQAKGVIEVRNLFRDGTKTTDLSISFSLGVTMAAEQHSKDVGEIMRQLNIGSGHKGAAAGTIFCSSKEEMMKVKEQTLRQMVTLFRQQ
ncbi:MAG: hypothetical protein QHJ34_11215 [bacterium]|jgi:nanoRNase/pAp phosphatase (c-di-AMP/oligoRNAs hydrolase)|nr:hypothetical protein [candidate division KSB1 bacterium]MDH7560782.1 hypothetical protein [bacterium]